MEETKIRLPGPGVFPTDMLGDCKCLENKEVGQRLIYHLFTYRYDSIGFS